MRPAADNTPAGHDRRRHDASGVNVETFHGKVLPQRTVVDSADCPSSIKL
jgi:hypothetical protein